MGRVYEDESGQGIPGLLIRAYDKDLLYDDFYILRLKSLRVRL